MSFNIKEIFTAFMVLFAVIDIVGNIPIIIDLRKKAGHIQSEKASVIAGVIMIIPQQPKLHQGHLWLSQNRLPHRRLYRC